MTVKEVLAFLVVLVLMLLLSEQLIVVHIVTVKKLVVNYEFHNLFRDVLCVENAVNDYAVVSVKITAVVLLVCLVSPAD